MRTLYVALALTICALVALQAAAHAWASAGLIQYLAQGGALDLSAGGPPPFPEALGIMIHGLNGLYVIPGVAIALLLVSLGAAVPGGVVRAGIVVVLVALQVTLGLFGHSVAALGFLHGANALALFAAALVAALAARRPVASVAQARVAAGVS